MYLLPAKYRPYLEAALKRMVADVEAGEVPVFGVDEQQSGMLVLGILEAKDWIAKMETEEIIVPKIMES